jgi:hypothetical protein
VVSYALAAGVVSFVGVVALLLTTGALEPISPLPPAVTWGGAGVGLLAVAAGRIAGPALRHAPSGADAHTVANRWATGGITAGALAEAAGMIGGVLALMDGDLLVGGGLAAISVLAILTGSPPREELEQRLRRIPSR